MFDKNDINEFDLMMKSILDEGAEEVPAGVWDKISEDLDKAAQHKRVVLWWRRAAAGTAVAAIVAAGVIFNHTAEDSILPEVSDKGMIAVVEEPAREEAVNIEEVEIVVPDMATKIPDMIAKAPEKVVPEREDAVVKTAEEALETVSDAKPVVTEEPVRKEVKTEDAEAKEYLPLEWGEEEKARKAKVSLVLSGIAATNDEQSKSRIGPMKAPTLTPAPEKTGITETGTKSSYGIPVSFGAGVKIGFSERWSLGIGANYTLLTRKFYGKYTKVNAAGSIENSTSSDIRNTQHFVGIPLNAYYNIVNKDRINLYAYAGGTAEKCISDNYTVLNTDIYHKEKVKGVQLSANAGIGVEFMLGKNLGLYIDPSIRYYFDCKQPKSIRTVQPLMLGFEMGFRAKL